MIERLVVAREASEKCKLSFHRFYPMNKHEAIAARRDEIMESEGENQY